MLKFDIFGKSSIYFIIFMVYAVCVGGNEYDILSKFSVLKKKTIK